MRFKKSNLAFTVFLLLLSIIAHVSSVLSTNGTIEYQWYRTWGGSDIEAGYGVATDSSGNIFLVGPTGFGEGYGSMALVKYDNSGILLWNLTWSGSGSETGYGVTVDSLNNVYIVGETGSFGAGGVDIALVKYDNSGLQQWNCTWGGSVISNVDIGQDVVVDSENNVYIVGYTENYGAGGDDIVLVKYDNSGVQLWNRTWGGADDDDGYGVAIDSSDNLYIIGETHSFGAGVEDMVLVKFDSSGIQQWNRTWGGGSSDIGTGVTVDSSNSVYISGTTESYGEGMEDMVLVKYDNSGVQLWNRSWGGNDVDVSSEVVVDSSGKVYLGGTTKSFTLLPDLVLVEYNNTGTKIGDYTWGTNGEDVIHSVAVDSSDNIYLGGRTTDYGPYWWDMILVKFGINNGNGGSDIYGYPILLVIGMIGLGVLITTYSIKKKSKQI